MSSKKRLHDPQGRHVRIYCSLLESHAWRVLGYSAQALFIQLRAGLTGTNNGNISATLSTLKHYGWNSSETLANALRELQAMGFIAQTRGGGVALGSRVCTLYRFTDLDCYEFPKLGIPFTKADHPYMQFASLADAKSAIENAKGKKTTIRKSKRSASKIEAKASFTASKIEEDDESLLRKSKQLRERENMAQTQCPKGVEADRKLEPRKTGTASKIEHLYMLPSIGAADDACDGVSA